MLQEGAIYVIKKQNNLREGTRHYKYIVLKYWNGRHWIVRFLKDSDTDWIALTEARILSMIGDGVIVLPDAHERLEAVMIEKKFDKFKWSMRKS